MKINNVKKITILSILLAVFSKTNATDLTQLNTNIDMKNPLGLQTEGLQKNKYAPSGCVEASYKVDAKGNAYDIVFLKQIPDSTHTNQSFNNISKMKHTPTNGEDKKIYFEFKGDDSWPLPFECLQTNEQSKRLIDINEQFLNSANLSELKEAIDARVFQSIYDSIQVNTSKPEIKKQDDGRFSATVYITWDTNINNAHEIISYYIKPKIGMTSNNNIQSISLTRDVYNLENEQEYNEEILNYIGQRKMQIETYLNKSLKTTVLASPMATKDFCKGTISQRTNFKSYCFMYTNKKGIPITFNDLDEEELNSLAIYSKFRITNTYLSALPNNNDA